jgi:hypothetical protein
MYLFSRNRRAQPAHIAEALGWAVETAAQASQICGLPVTAWSDMWSANAGTIAWTALPDDLATLEQAGDKLAVDAAFGDRVRDGEAFLTGPVVDTLAQIVHGAPPDAPSQYVSVVTGELVPGSLRAGLEGGIEIATLAERIIGRPTLFTVSTTGRYGAIAWITGHADITEVESAQAALNAENAFLALVDRVSTCFQADAEQSLYRRLA